MKRRQIAIYLLVSGVFLTMSTLPAFTAGPKGQVIGQGNIHGRGILPLADGGVNSSGITVGSHVGQININGTMTSQGISKAGNIGTMDGYVVMADGGDVLLGRPGSNVVLKINSQQDSTPGNAAKVKFAGGNELVLAAGDVFFNAIVKNHYASSPHPEPEENGNKGPGEYKRKNKSEGKSYRWRYRWRHRKPDDPPPNNPPEDPDPPEPPEPSEIFVEAAPLPKELMFKIGECPALMAMATEELGVTQDNPQVYLADALANSKDIQPCDMCARLLDSAAILRDTGGTGIAALKQVVNEFIQPAAPVSEEQMASISQALSDYSNGDDKDHYAAAIQWLDSLAEYIGILTLEIGWPENESMAFAAGKYVTPVIEEGDSNLAMFLLLQLAALSGS